MSDVKITYEVLFELFRLEKSKEELQKLDSGFVLDVQGYLAERKRLVDGSLYSEAEKEKARNQLNNVTRILKDLYDRREKKIVNLALNKVRTRSDLIDISALLDEERMLFDMLVAALFRAREDVRARLLEAKASKAPEPRKTEVKEPEEPKDLKISDKTNETKVNLRFLEDLPKFVGLDLEIYGPFQKGDESELPVEIADLVVSKGQAEKA
jgi:DNA replication initiation complex subunit (GINS family)